MTRRGVARRHRGTLRALGERWGAPALAHGRLPLRLRALRRSGPEPSVYRPEPTPEAEPLPRPVLPRTAAGLDATGYRRCANYYLWRAVESDERADAAERIGMPRKAAAWRVEADHCRGIAATFLRAARRHEVTS